MEFVIGCLVGLLISFVVDIIFAIIDGEIFERSDED